MMKMTYESIRNRKVEVRNYVLDVQAGVCALCRRPIVGAFPQPPVDHNHETGLVRGVLCSRCNLWLGGYEKLLEVVTVDRIEEYRLGWLEWNG